MVLECDAAHILMERMRRFKVIDVECEMDVAFLRTDLEDRFFFARVTDRTVLSIDPADYLYDESSDR